MKIEKRREGKIMMSLVLLFNLLIIVVFIIAIGFMIPSPRVFHSWRRKRRVDYGLGGSENPWKSLSHAAAPLGVSL
jgi:hypothetical protein